MPELMNERLSGSNGEDLTVAFARPNHVWSLYSSQASSQRAPAFFLSHTLSSSSAVSSHSQSKFYTCCETKNNSYTLKVRISSMACSWSSWSPHGWENGDRIVAWSRPLWGAFSLCVCLASAHTLWQIKKKENTHTHYVWYTHTLCLIFWP